MKLKKLSTVFFVLSVSTAAPPNFKTFQKKKKRGGDNKF